MTDELIALERSLLGACMLHPQGWRDASEHITAASFYRGTHRTAWEAICGCYAKWEIAEPLLVSDYLTAKGLTEPTALDLTDMQAEAPLSSGAVAHYARRVAEHAHRRHLEQSAQQLARQVADPSVDTAEALADHMRALEQVNNPSGRLWTLHDDSGIDNITPPAWLIDGHVTAGLTFISGAPKTGKSFLVLDMAFSIAAGRPWFGHAVSRGRVVYVAAEGASGISMRRAAWKADRKSGTNGFHLIGQPVNLRDPRHVAALIADVEAVKAKVLVIDTLARCTPGADESSSRDMGEVVGNLDQIRTRTGCAVIVVHHLGKDTAKGLRGSSALPGALDTEIRVTTGPSGVMAVECANQKDAAPFPRWLFELHPVGASCVLTTSNSTVPDPARFAPWETPV